MKNSIKILALCWCLLLINAGTYAGSGQMVLEQICSLIQQKRFARAEELYKQQHKMGQTQRWYVEACLDNVFNRLSDSEHKIDSLLKQKHLLADSLLFTLYSIRKDNAVKLYRYKEAAATIKHVLASYGRFLTPEKKADWQNDLQLWAALENTPAQTIHIRKNTTLKLRADKAGLKNITVHAGKDSVDGIFDTGANISTLSESAARKMRLQIIPVAVKVTSITGKEVVAKLAVADSLFIGNIELRNVVFLVFDDKDLAFSQIGYQINCILGFPVIEAMKEIQLTRDGWFKVAKTARNKAAYECSMALDGLIPVISVEGNAFTLDTGADQTLLYRPYYMAHKAFFDRECKADSVSFGGAGGGRKVRGCKVARSLQFCGKTVVLSGIELLMEDIKKGEAIYGNIGQDVIKQFNSMTLNFEAMFIGFE